MATTQVMTKCAHCGRTRTGVMHDWLEYSSFHGIVDITRPGYGKIWKCSWILIMLAFAAFTIWTVYLNVDSFIDNPTMQEYKHEPNNRFDMPDLLICTHQRFNVTRLMRMGASIELINGIISYSSLGKEGLIWNLDEYNDPNASSHKIRFQKLYKAFLEHNGYPDFNDILRKASIDCRGLILKCSWSDDCCAPEIAKPVLTLQFGQCYRFITSSRTSKRPQQFWPGPDAGLQMVVNGNLDECGHLKGSIAKGVLLDVAAPNESMTYSYSQIPLGVVATVQLSLQKSERINLPLRKPSCRHRVPASENSTEEAYEAMKATANGCYYLMWAMAVANICNCNPMYGIDIKVNGSRIRTCHPFEEDICYAGLPEGVVNAATMKSQAENCLPQCVRSAYRVSVSYGTFDFEAYQEAWGRRNSTGGIDKNSILLNIYHPNMEIVHIREAETISPTTLLSNIGGAAGLWLGASLMSFFQAIFYFAKWLSIARSKTVNDPS